MTLTSSRLSGDETSSAPQLRVKPARAADERLARMLEAHFEAVWSALRRLGVPESSTDDAAQEVFIIAARRLETIETGRERPYLYGIALRVAANARRARLASREQPNEVALMEAPAESPGADVLLDEKRLREMLDEALNSISQELRTVFVLFEFEGFSEREIAELCAVPLGTVASRLRRAREAFHRAAQRLKRRLSEASSA